MPITGLPSNTSEVNPWLRIHARWFIPDLPVAANHVELRLLVVMILLYRRAGVRGKPLAGEAAIGYLPRLFELRLRG
jgi:hypothetical protein